MIQSALVMHQYHQNIGDFQQIFDYIKNQKSVLNSPKLHLYPELFLTGYPLQDLCLQKSFFASYTLFLKTLDKYFKEQSGNDDIHLMGGLSYDISDSGFPEKIKNSMFLAQAGVGIKAIYHKRLLPSYDIFDESKYFTPGEEIKSIKWQGLNIGLLICEDMWTSVHYKANPIKEMKASGESFDLIINMSASPFGIRKHHSRLEQAKEISHTLKAPFAYVNLVGEEDEILFDGGSFLVNGDQTLEQLSFFKGESKSIILRELSDTNYKEENQEAISHSWEDLFRPYLAGNLILPLNEEECENLLQSLTFGLAEYARKNGFSKYLVALSGGIDSTLALTIAKLALKQGQSIEAIYMPSQFSSPASLKLSQQLCSNLDIPLKVLPIKFLHSVVRTTFKDHFKDEFSGVPDENIQSRLRGSLLYARSNQTGAMVINTSNKSELAVGYSTLYGDSVGALSVIGDLFKTEVYALSKYINKVHGLIIPYEIIDRAPTAELRENQIDADSLPPYPILDTILECLLSYRFDRSDLLNIGISEKYIDKVLHLYCRSEFKRKQFCPILKVKTKSFGFGYRIPINKSKSFYFD